MKAYIAGPMTGYPNFNFDAFDEAQEALEAIGVEVVNPANNFDRRQDLPWYTYLRKAVAQVTECDAIFMLDGWQESRGASLELLVASWLDVEVYGFAQVFRLEPNESVVIDIVFDTYGEREDA